MNAYWFVFSLVGLGITLLGVRLDSDILYGVGMCVSGIGIGLALSGVS